MCLASVVCPNPNASNGTYVPTPFLQRKIIFGFAALCNPARPRIFYPNRLLHMKPFCLLLLLLCSRLSLTAQTDYNKQWKSVDALIQKKHLPKSALLLVKKIYAQARREGADAQALKALVYQTDLGEETREEAHLAAIAETEKELAASRQPYASVLNSMAAGLYLRYFEEHRWNLYRRTATETPPPADVTKWTSADFHRKITGLYLASLKEKALLQQTAIEAFAPLVVKGNAPALRPTLYDLLAHKALEYFESDEQYVTKPEAVFTLNDPALFAPAKNFASLTVHTPDTASLLHKALLIYQGLLTFHAGDKAKEALLDADLARIRFVKRYATVKDKDGLFEKALLNLLAEYAGNKAVNEAAYLLAEQYNEKGQTYQPFTDTLSRFERVKAVKLLAAVVSDSSVKNKGWADGYNLLQEIKRPSLQLTVEKVTLPSEPFRVLVKYKNLASVTARLILSSQKLTDRLEDDSTLR